MLWQTWCCILNIMKIIPDSLITTHLEMASRAAFRPAFSDDLRGITIERMDTADVAFYRFLYAEVGGDWQWRDRLYLSDFELEDVLSSPSSDVFVLYVRGTPAGYVELAQHGSEIEIAYFGLRKRFMGRGLGKHLLSYGIQQAWAKNPTRVWLHTCNLDGPHALENYLKRGFTAYRVDEEPMPERYQ